MHRPYGDGVMKGGEESLAEWLHFPRARRAPCRDLRASGFSN
jgi:hypothetical protein